jgi:ATP-dependent helicase/nuclease subunit A
MNNERLIANAGSGKTYALTTRMIQLLAQEVEPRRIAALTFTRKSAGEFLSAVFERLAEAAMDPKKLAELQSKPLLENIDAARCCALLRKLASQLGSLGMGTIDGFFARIARAFPLESGLAEDFSMAGEADIQSARERTLAWLFASETETSLADFLELLRRVNRNQGERDVFQNLLRESQKLHAKFLATPRNAIWGDSSVIWAGTVCSILRAGPVSSAVDDFLDAVLTTHPQFSAEAEGILRVRLEQLRGIVAGRSWNKEITEFVKLRLAAEPPSRSLRITPKKEGWLHLNEPVSTARRALLNAVLKSEFETLLLRSRSIHALMQKFEEIYSTLIRSAGLVTFADITDSLAKRAGDQAWRDVVGYRIDQKFDHWLLDEFQDTSRPQWKILKLFIDEVIMDSEQRRSFFYVGDTKQAIYSWRGGDPDLFFEIFDHYNENAPVIQDAKPLDQSFRSCKHILDFVNRVFGDLTPVKATLEIPEAAAEKWNEAWRVHMTSEKTRDLQGYAVWHSVPKDDADEDTDGDAQERKVLKILETTKAWERGLSCAVLKRDNNGVESLAALLQSKGIPVAVEGKTNPCVDNPLGGAILAALRLCASPDDKLSEAVLKGFPAAEAWGFLLAWEFRNRTLAKLANEGFASTIRAWVDASPLQSEPFLQERAAAFLTAAEEFDACRKSSEGIPEFLRFVESRQSQENEASDVVRVMTIHQSKGLGFDMVIATGLDRQTRSNEGIRLTLGPEVKDIKWGIELPAKDFAEHDPVLRRQIEITQAENKLAEICTAYVCLTRPKKALYVVTTELGENTKSKNFARHLSLQFANSESQFGNPYWYQAYPLSKTGDTVPVSQRRFYAPLNGTPKPLSPSSFKAETFGGMGSASVTLEAADLGTEVHEALAELDWLKPGIHLPGNISAEAEKLVRVFLEKPIARQVFTQPEQHHELWRERAFDVLIEGQWISGVFDRVLVHHCVNGSPTSAIVYDFKTDYASSEAIAQCYAGQMEVYQKAAAQLLGLDEASVETQIIAVR